MKPSVTRFYTTGYYIISGYKSLIYSHLRGVGVTGFEPATTWSQTRCATGLRYAPNATAKLAIFFDIATILTKFFIFNSNHSGLLQDFR